MKALAFIPLVALLAACDKKQELAAPPPLPVTIAKPVKREVTVYRELPATLEGVTEIQIRARVKGILEESKFKEGDWVQAGTELFVIEPEPYELAVDAAEADLESAKASRDLAQKRYERVAKAAKTRAVSEIDVEIAAAEVSQSAASVSQAVAQLDEAKINAGYTRITAPISGRLSQSLVDPGNLVGATESTLLTTIIDDSRIRAFFEVPERDMIRYLGERALEGGVERFADREMRLVLANGTIYDKFGTIDFIDNTIDPSTRTAKVRALFPNKEAKLSSGLYGLVGFPAGPDPNDPHVTSGLLVPSVAVLRDLGGDFVWIVDEQNIVRRRGVEAGASVEKPVTDENALKERETVIVKGLDGSENVIVAGLQRARDGAIVQPMPAGAKPPAKGN